MPHAIPMGLTTSLTISLTFVHAFVHTEYFRAMLTFAKPTIHSRVCIMPTPFASTSTRKAYARDETRTIGVRKSLIHIPSRTAGVSPLTLFRPNFVGYRDTLAHNPHIRPRSFRLYPLGIQ